MNPDLTDVRWFKSSTSTTNGCVEVAHLPGGGAAVRDTKDRGKAPHIFTRHEWECFLTGAKNGEFDPPSFAARRSPASQHPGTRRPPADA